MSMYTVQLRWPIEQTLKNQGVQNTEDNWPLVWETLGLNDYPIFNEEYRAVLNNNIMRHYYFREIGFETLGQFRFHIRRHMFEIMPYYNKLYLAQLQIINPLWERDLHHTEDWNVDNTQTQKQDSSRDSAQNTSEDRTTSAIDNTHSHTGSASTTDVVSSSTDTTSTINNDRNVFQDTPMNALDTSAVSNLQYATNVTYENGDSSNTTKMNSSDQTKVADTTETTGENNSSESVKDIVDDTYNETFSNLTDTMGNEDGDKNWHEWGYSQSQSLLFLQYRKAIVNIDMEIIDSLQDYFFMLWQ